MKRVIHLERKGLGMGLFFLALGAALPGVASDNAGKKGYWVVETSELESTSVVRLYNEHDEVIHEERLDGKTIHLTSRNIKKLNRLLDSYVNNRLVELALR